MTLKAPEAQHRDRRQSRQERRQREQDGVAGTQLLLGVDHPCLITGPSDQQVDSRSRSP